MAWSAVGTHRETLRNDDLFEIESGSGPDSNEPKLRSSMLLSSSSAKLEELVPSSLDIIMDDVDDRSSPPLAMANSLAFFSFLLHLLSEIDLVRSLLSAPSRALPTPVLLPLPLPVLSAFSIVTVAAVAVTTVALC